MSAMPTRKVLLLAEISQRDIARAVAEGRRRQAEEVAKLFRALGRGLVCLGRALVTRPVAPRPTQDGMAEA